MSNRYIKGGIYHIFNRGNNKQPIAHDVEDYLKILKLFFRRTLTTGDKVLGYCVMPNHFHFILLAMEEFSISDLMKSFGISYNKYFNDKHNCVGHIFQGVYKSKHVDNIPYLVHLSKYIHKNPYKDGLIKMVGDLKSYPWSSYRQYLDPHGNGNAFRVDPYPVLDLFSTREQYQSYVEDNATLSIQKFLNPEILYTYVEEQLQKEAGLLSC